MDNVMQGLPTAIECKPPKELSSIAVDLRKLEELNQKYTQMAILYQELNEIKEYFQKGRIK
jgi:hypothetical protein